MIGIRKIGDKFAVVKIETKIYVLTSQDEWEERQGYEKILASETIEIVT